MIRFVTSAREAAIVAITMCLLSLTTHAEEPVLDTPPADLQTAPSPPTPAEAVPSTPPLLLKKSAETHIAVSHSLERMARNIAAFFADDQTFDERTRSYARVRIDTTRTVVHDRLDDTPIDVVRRQDYLRSIERVNDGNKWDVRPAAGIKLRWVPDPFLRLRATRYHDLSGWLMRTAG